MSIQNPQLNVKNFLICFTVLFFAYFFDMANFLEGNHDGGHAYSRPFWATHISNGRLIGYYIEQFFSYGLTLPVISNVIAYCCMTLTALKLCEFWECKDQKNIILSSFIFILSPLWLSFFSINLS